jgi:hypothetical protein
MPSPLPLQLTELLAAGQGLDRHGQRLLYQHYYGFAASICRRYLPNPAVALAATNDGFLKVFKELPGATADAFRNALALGFDVETGGHVFQLHATNSQGMIEKFFIPQTTGNFLKGDIFLGFNIARAFQLRKQP